MAARKTFTPEQKAEALRIYVESGPAEAARQTGIEAGLISKWAQRAGLVSEAAGLTARATETAKANRERRKAELADDLLNDAQRLRRQLWEPSSLPHWGPESKREGNITTTTDVYQEQVIGEPPYKEKLEILRSVDTAAKLSQLLAGEATARNEQVNVREVEEALNDAIRDPDARRRFALKVLSGADSGVGEARAS